MTDSGHKTTRGISLLTRPDILLISPMTRAIQTALNMFPFLQEDHDFPIAVQIWPDLRETHDSECNRGLTRADLESKFPAFDSSCCKEDWDYAPHTAEAATARAEAVRKRLKELSAAHRNIAVVTHRGFIAFLAKGRRFDTCEIRSYRFATDEEAHESAFRKGVNCDTLLEQDFGPTVLVLDKDARRDMITSMD